MCLIGKNCYNAEVKCVWIKIKKKNWGVLSVADPDPYHDLEPISGSL